MTTLTKALLSSSSFGFRWNYLVLAIIAGVVQAVLMEDFLQCDYIQLGIMDKDNWSTDAGYTTAEFWSLFWSTILFPVFILSFIVYSYQAHLRPPFGAMMKVRRRKNLVSSYFFSQ